MDHTADPALAPVWETIGTLHAWLDAEGKHRQPPRQETLLRVLKLSEEVGEVAAAIIGATGQNPRKGVTHSWQDVEAELCDVIVTAMVALRTLTPDAEDVFAGHLRRIADRSRSTGSRTDVGPAEAQLS